MSTIKSGFSERIKQWFSPSDESEPLLDQPRKSRWIFSLVSSSVALLLLGLSIVYWILYHDSTQDSPPVFDFLSSNEKEFLNLPSNTQIRDYLKIYTSQAHLAGTSIDRQQAEWTRDQFESFGLNTTIDTYWPLLNYPISHEFALVTGPDHLRYKAKLREDPVQEDETSHDPDVVPTFHGYSRNGTARGRVVYANYGRLEDFEFLQSQGIQLNGTIALVRYGGSFRGLKVRAAEVYGCIGVLIYSDPIDDGPTHKKESEGSPAKSYPEGPWRSASSAQRGSVLFLSILAGDPLTPGYPALENATRQEDSDALAKIPSLPLSWEDALPLLKATQGLGVRATSEWTGGLEVEYFSGPTEGEAVLVNNVKNKITPIWNVIGRIEGKEEPEKTIVLGNHRDAWVYGAVDPSSGSSAMLELARVFGILMKNGWRPRRSIVFASWDAEEYGLVGSTEWVEDNKEWLDKEAVVYINVDTAVSGPHFEASASPSLNRLIYEIASLIKDPRTGGSIYDAWSADYSNVERPEIGQLGSGSDFVAFLDHVGIASVNLAFKGNYGVYHSNYDSFHWMERFGDPDFAYHGALVKVWGLLALRLADNPIIPLYPSDYAAELRKYVKNLNSYSSYDLKQLVVSVNSLERAARKFETQLDHLAKRLAVYGNSLEKAPKKLLQSLKKVNNQLTYFERGLTDPEGIPGRTWFKHVVYAPGLWTGYSSQVFPAIVDSIDADDVSLVKYTEERAAKSIKRAARILH